jgi:hypothetical protein
VENDQAPAMRAHVLADGTPLTLGMRVVDYDRKHGVIVDDRDARFPRNAVALDVPHQHRTSSGVQPIPPGREAAYTCEAWFDVLCDDGSTSWMDCSRMVAEGGRLDR